MAAGARILVVDDEPAVVQMVAHVLKRAGYDVLPASGARQALEIVRNEQKIDLVLSDIVMPEMQGPELVREIGRIAPGIVPVLMSGYAADPERLPAGVPLLLKPLSLSHLVGTLETILSRSEKARNQTSRAGTNRLRPAADRTLEGSRDALRRQSRDPQTLL